MAKIDWDDAWILYNWKTFRNWYRLCISYNEVHQTNILYTTFKAHCYKNLGLNFHYSKEQEEWLKENYPKLGRIKTAKAFNKMFHENKTPEAIKMECQKLGLHVNESRRKERAIENTKRYHPTGSIRLGAHDEPYLKTKDGWIRVKELVMGKIEKGQVIIHLDQDPTNCDESNLMIVSRSILQKMMKNKFWSENPEITRTGVIWCKLYEALKEQEHINGKVFG